MNTFIGQFVQLPSVTEHQGMRRWHSSQGGLHRMPSPDPLVGRRFGPPLEAAVALMLSPFSGVVAFGMRGHYKTRSKLGPPDGTSGCWLVRERS